MLQRWAKEELHGRTIYQATHPRYLHKQTLSLASSTNTFSAPFFSADTMVGVLKETKTPKVESIPHTHSRGPLERKAGCTAPNFKIAKLGGLFENCVYNREPGDRSELGEGRGGRASSPALHTPPTNKRRDSVAPKKKMPSQIAARIHIHKLLLVEPHV